MEIKKLYRLSGTTYFGDPEVATHDLEQSLQQLGFHAQPRIEHRVTSLGSIQDIVPVVAHLSLSTSSVLGILTLNLLSSVIYDSLKEIRAAMHKHGVKQDPEVHPIVRVAISGKPTEESNSTLVPIMDIKFSVDVDNSKESILAELEATPVDQAFRAKK